MEKIKWENKIEGDFVFDLKQITVDTFDKTAHCWALVIANADKGVEKNQLRNFYDKILELEEKAINADEDEFKTKILPFVKMIKSKVAYARNRQTSPINKAFELFMNTAIDQISSKQEFLNFKFLFEAVLGFYRKDKNVLLKTNDQESGARDRGNHHKNNNDGGTKRWK